MIQLINIVYVSNSEFGISPLELLNNDKDINISLVITQPDKKRSRNKVIPSPIKSKALELGLKVYTSFDINKDDDLKLLKEVGADFIVVVSFGQVISKRLLETFKDKIINLHSSILPKYRGASPINETLLNLDEIAGSSIMLIDEKMDTGDILKTTSFEVDPSFKYEELSEKLSIIGGEDLVDVIKNYDYYFKKRKPQKSSEASYTKLIKKSDGQIDFSQKSDIIEGKFKAYSVWPQIYFNYKGMNIKIIDFYFINRQAGLNGEIVKVCNDGVFINCKDKTLVITKIGYPGKKSMEVSEFLKGNSIEKIIIGG